VGGNVGDGHTRVLAHAPQLGSKSAADS
jgi:hypothetical protein